MKLLFEQIGGTYHEENGYLAEIDKQDEDTSFRLVKQMTECNEMTENSRRINKWSGARANNIRSRATEIVNHDISYT